jgi:hypothetical protein
MHLFSPDPFSTTLLASTQIETPQKRIHFGVKEHHNTKNRPLDVLLFGPRAPMMSVITAPAWKSQALKSHHGEWNLPSPRNSLHYSEPTPFLFPLRFSPTGRGESPRQKTGSCLHLFGQAQGFGGRLARLRFHTSHQALDQACESFRESLFLLWIT